MLRPYTCLKLRHAETEIIRDLLEGWRSQISSCKKRIVKLPESILFSGTISRACCGQRIAVSFQRHVLKNQTHFFAVRLQDLFQRRLYGVTERTLKIRELHDRDKRFKRPSGR